MKRISFLTLFLVLTSLILVPLAFAKGSPDKITIWGPALAEPIEITDPKVLKWFDPWNGQFLDQNLGTITEELRVEQTYYVFFYFRDRDGEFREFYTFQYAPNSAGRRGFIYLPKEGEPWRLMNSQTIARANSWHYASEEWDMLMQQMLENPQASPTASLITDNLRITLLIITLLGGAVMIWVFRRMRPMPA
jgi:hypothetical protein